MKLLLLVGLAAQLPFAATSSNPFDVPSPPAIALPPGSSATQVRTNEEMLRQLFATTKSVMKRRSEAAPTADPSAQHVPANPAAMRDDQFVQASNNQNQSGALDRQGETNEKAPNSSSPATAGDTDPARSAAAVDSTTRAAANASSELLAAALASPPEDALDGRPVSLAQALGSGPNSAQRLERASLYWKLALAIADYHWAVDEALQLGTLLPNKSPIDAPLLAAAQAAAKARMLEAKAAAVTAQQELADAIGQPTQPLPITVEQPLVGPYRTEFDTIFANRTAPGRSRAIHRGMPHWREAIDLRAAAVQAAASAVAPADNDYGAQMGSVQTVLYVHRELAQHRRAFLNAVRQYNAEIVEYVAYVAGPSTSTATLVSMLTRSKPNKLSDSGPSTSAFAGSNEPTLAAPRLDPNVRQAAGAEEIRNDQWQGIGRSTGDAVTPTESGAPAEPATNLQQIEEGRED